MGKRESAKQEYQDLLNRSEAPPQFVDLMLNEGISYKAQRAVLGTLDDLAVPSSSVSPQRAEIMTRRCIEHLTNCINAIKAEFFSRGPEDIDLDKLPGIHMHYIATGHLAQSIAELADDLVNCPGDKINARLTPILLGLVDVLEGINAPRNSER